MRPVSYSDRPDPPLERPIGRRKTFRLSPIGRRLAAVGGSIARLPQPRFGLVAICLVGSAGLYGMVLGGHTTGVVDALAEPLGFAIDKVDVSGNAETSEIDVLQTLWSTGSRTLPSLDVEAARTMLETIPWIEKASVAKTYPDRVSIDLVEKHPFALWQKERELHLIDRQGRQIMNFVPNRFQDLPFVVGPGAERDAAGIVDALAAVPELRARVSAYVRVGNRRWDLRLDNGLTVRLPEDGAVEAAAEIARMDKDMGLLSRDISVVDMRIADRVTVRLTADAATRRAADLKERDKLLKRMAKEKRA